jgi:hypothetical protein
MPALAAYSAFTSTRPAFVGLPMKFSVYLPPQANFRPVPALLYLAGLTCTEETFMAKAGAQRVAAERGLALIAPDTSPRGAGAPGEAENWDFGVGAGFYLDATQAPWSRHYRMESYITAELLPLAGAITPGGCPAPGCFRAFHGGPWCPDPGPQTPRACSSRCRHLHRFALPRSAPGDTRHSPVTWGPTPVPGQRTMPVR